MASGRNTDFLKQRIVLDGGKEFEAELKALGKAGEDAFNQLQAAAGRLSFGNTVQREINAIREQFTRVADAGRDVRKNLTDIGDGFDRFAKRVGVATLAITGAAV